VTGSASARVPRAPVAEVATSRLSAAHRPSLQREAPLAAAPPPRSVAQQPEVPAVATPPAAVGEVVDDGGLATPAVESVPQSVVEKGANTLREALPTPGPKLPAVPAVPVGA